MKPLFFCLIVCLTAPLVHPTYAQTDSLSAADTISLTRQRLLLSVRRMYRYHLASGLLSRQMVPLLKQSPDEEVHRYIQKYTRQRAFSGVTSLLPFPLLASGLLLSQRSPELGGALTLTGLVMSFVPPFFRVEHNMERAVRSHNLSIRTQSGDYYRPMFDLRPQSDRLVLTDSVQIKGSFIYPKFVYRGLRVDPATNLKTAFEYLNSGRVNANLRYIRTVRTVSGFVSGLAFGVLTGTLLSYAVRNATGSYPLNRGVVYPALGTIGITVLANWHANQVQLGTMKEYNLKIKERGVRRQDGAACAVRSEE